jgi:hypothetical protein
MGHGSDPGAKAEHQPCEDRRAAGPEHEDPEETDFRLLVARLDSE